jgi:hypothetical protein
MKFLIINLLVILTFVSCMKDKTVPSTTPNSVDTISKIIDSIVGSYRVFVVSYSWPSGQNDTLGFDTLSIGRVAQDSISILNYALSIVPHQLINDSGVAFNGAENFYNATAIFYIDDDSIDFNETALPLWESCCRTRYAGRKI